MSVQALLGRRVMAAVVVVVGLARLTTATPQADLITLTQDYWDWKIQEFPQFATKFGLHDSTVFLDHINTQHFQQQKDKCEEFLERARGIDAASLSHEDLVTLKVFKEDMMTFTQNFPYKKYHTLISALDGPQYYFKKMVEKQIVLNNYNDYQNLLLTYGQFPRQAQEILTLLRGNMEDNIMPSNWSMVGVVDQLEDLMGPVEDSVFYKPFINMPQTITPEQRTTLQQQAMDRIKQDLIPAFTEIRNFLVTEYLPSTRGEVGASSLPGGKEYYQACLTYHTSTNLTPQDIHELGLKEVARIEQEVQKTAAELGMEGKTFSEISQALRDDPAQSFTSTDDLLDTFRNTVYNVIYPRVLEMFPSLPPVNLTIVAENNPNMGARYSSASIDGSRLGSFIIGSYKTRMRYGVMALSLHEVYPGHHLYDVFIQTNPSIPSFRKYVDYTFLANAPARFPINTAITEGWGLYSEFLGEELDLYTDPYQMMGRHSFELLRASRLVVDTGMHALGWSRDTAVTFLLDHTALSNGSVQAQINRYITWPGQACAYKVGEIKIKELRQKAQNALGSLFRLSDFHSVLLGCVGPLKIVEECVTSYIEQTNLVIEKGDHDKHQDKTSEGGDPDEKESLDPKQQSIESESVGSEATQGGGCSSVVGCTTSVLVWTVCWMATLHTTIHMR